MAPARRYAESCSQLKPFNVIRNNFDSLPASFLDPLIEKKLTQKGYSCEELLAVTHVFIARKAGINLTIIADRLQLILRRYGSASTLKAIIGRLFAK
ncbi:hypothetical protein [uncultured Desulfobulbus sp.]|uniref:hypothetical protein n=1 Tax=uncultured Desulfobulbus sp. TaxID=239745 RepID=UPI0029C8D716|nr:hypothetical protein [uncultured Desulfobulbus sp.]